MQVVQAVLLGQFAADGVQPHRVLDRGDGKGGGEPVKAVCPGVLGGAFQPHAVTHGAALAALRLVFQPFYRSVKLLRVIRQLHHRDAAGSVPGIAHKTFQFGFPAVVFLRWGNVGVII